MTCFTHPLAIKNITIILMKKISFDQPFLFMATIKHLNTASSSLLKDVVIKKDVA